ncbi:Crp/Fnr family transcriptional regulator [Isoalcanivorax indicus]|uniref:Crp/Fnr family transcriptional regulator n=1 Tax=Isoalcanivorax indicus TaxID=2202653 RepID=UPI000DB9D995|nr:Crp/Fnr family transcriptional regulator [Isoalcanivorax indicus]
MIKAPRYQDNQLLGALSHDARERLYPHLRLAELPLESALYESGDVMKDVFFPTDAVISLLYVMEDGHASEIAMIGHEGMVGIALFMGGLSTPSRAIVQCQGHAWRLGRKQLMAEFDLHGQFHHLLLRYTQTLITQMAQTAVCNRHHSIDQQLCRWLLLSLDRRKGDRLDVTQELIAGMLGVRRESVTKAASKLQDAGVIQYHRGHIHVLNRPEIERRCCECYAVVKNEFDRLLDDASKIPRHLKAPTEK